MEVCALTNFRDNWSDTTSLFEWQEPAETYYPGLTEPVAPGPLMISTLAMFGNNSWWHAVATSNETLSIPSNDSIAQSLTAICQSAALPFTGFLLATESFGLAADTCINVNDGFDGRDTETDWQAIELRTIVYGWFSSLHSNNSELNQAANILDATTFFANEAVLTAAADLNFAFGAKWIYTSEGTLFYQPYKSLGGMIAVSVLILLQVIALLVLSWYTHMTAPVWTDTLDGFAMMRIGAEMARGNKQPENDLDQPWELGKLQFGEEKDLLKLKDVDGLVGVIPAGGGEQHEAETREKAPLTESTAQPVGESAAVTEKKNDQGAERPLLLGLGAPGVITKNLGKRKKEKGAKSR